MLYRDQDYRREVEEEQQDAWRSEFRRDYGRFIHSASFRRLQGKMQLFPGTEGDYFRSRLTHSLEVAQIAKSIGLKLNFEIDEFKENPIDTDLLEFAGLAHDLGHPPFGHTGEKALDDWMKDLGGFEGNAQTLRILSKLEKKILANEADEAISSDGQDMRKGLNLTHRSLASILKYDNEIPRRREEDDTLVKGYYQSEADLVRRIKQSVACVGQTSEPFKTIECQIMDVADDIAYSTYDLEDALKSGLISLLDLFSVEGLVIEEVASKVSSTLGREVSVNEVVITLWGIADTIGFFDGVYGFEYIRELQDDPMAMAYFLGNVHNTSKVLGSNGYYRTAFTSSLVGEFIGGVRVNINSNCLPMSRVTLEEDIYLKVEVLKHLTYQRLINSPKWEVVSYRATDIIDSIFEALDSEQGCNLLPADFKCIHDGYGNIGQVENKQRTICDFIACMTDAYAVEFYARLKSENPQSIFKPF